MGGLEFFVIGLCVGGWNCSEAPRAYYLQNQQLQDFVKVTERKAKDMAGPVVSDIIIPYTMPFVLLANGQKGRINLNKHWSLEGSTKEQSIKLEWNW